jgi:hypothetical protein
MDSDGAQIPVKRSTSRSILVALLAALACVAPVHGQGRGGGGRGGGGRGAPPNPKATAAFDMTGYWVSVVTEDWMFRMVTPPKGKYLGVPMSAEGRRVADAWDPAKDEAEGNQCKAYGAAGLMRLPGRLHVTWENDNTLRIDTDAGTQTRLFHFSGPQAQAQPAQNVEPQSNEPTWQGNSAAEWELAAPAGRGQPRAGDLKVVTTNLKPGYLRKNGVPYGANTMLTEYYDLHAAPDGDVWLVVTTEVKDPQYLTQSFVTSTHFKKQADATGWNPEPCSAK